MGVADSHLPDCHLVRTVIPRLPLADSLGDFHCKADPDLSLFCRYGFRKRYKSAKWPQCRNVVPSSPHIHARQATLHTAHDSAHCLAGSYQVRTQSEPRWVVCRCRTEEWSPRRAGRIPHAIGVRPLSLTPSIHPKLGVTSRHKGLHRWALRRIFRPCLEKGALTRILRRRTL